MHYLNCKHLRSEHNTQVLTWDQFINEKSVDSVRCFEIITHIQDISEDLKNMFYKLKPGVKYSFLDNWYGKGISLPQSIGK